MRTATMLTLVAVVMAGLTVPVFDVWGGNRLEVGVGSGYSRSYACREARNNSALPHSGLFTYVKIHQTECSCEKTEEGGRLVKYDCEVQATYRKERDLGQESQERHDKFLEDQRDSFDNSLKSIIGE